MGNKNSKPAHPQPIGPHPVCLAFPIGSCWWCAFWPDPKNEHRTACPAAPKGVTLSDSHNSELFIPAGYLEYQGVVYDICPDICLGNGGTWAMDNASKGCHIGLEDAIYADISTAVVHTAVSRDISHKVAPAIQMKQEHLAGNIGLIAIILGVCFLGMWAQAKFQSDKSKRVVNSDCESAIHT